MSLYVPDYYPEFHCLMGECVHNCCVGWEIDIDPETASQYRQIKGDIGKKLAESIAESEEGAHFRLTEQERCPFLNDDGLCELILNLGEDSLCQICADHPRFRNYIGDREEIGLGLCCEAAARLILSRKNPVRLIRMDGSDVKDNSEDVEFLQERQVLFDLAQDRKQSVFQRACTIAETVFFDLKGQNLLNWGAFLKGLERLDDAWTKRLDSLQDEPMRTVDEIASEQLLVYLLYRHLPGTMDDGDWDGRVAFCVLMWRILCAMAERSETDDLPELVRMYSAEIEYSDENIGAILDEIDNSIPPARI